jgi:hypothetical protein
MGSEPTFDCLRCGKMSIVRDTPPRCPHCGSGSGVIETPIEERRRAPRLPSEKTNEKIQPPEEVD